MLVCTKCGKVAKRDGVVVMSAEGDHCVSKAACKKRRNQRPQYDWSQPQSFETWMST